MIPSSYEHVGSALLCNVEFLSEITTGLMVCTDLLHNAIGTHEGDDRHLNDWHQAGLAAACSALVMALDARLEKIAGEDKWNGRNKGADDERIK